jgi:hypothetical protein
MNFGELILRREVKEAEVTSFTNKDCKVIYVFFLTRLLFALQTWLPEVIDFIIDDYINWLFFIEH